MSKFPLVAILLAAVGVCVNAQPAVNREAGDLFTTIASLDHALFDAYNRCELEKFGSMLAEDLEFYHDQTGLELGRQRIVESIKKNICGKVRRELVAGSLEVYPLKGFGAVEIGVHRFMHPGRDDREPMGEAKFVHIWREREGKWVVSRVISFDHRAVKERPGH